MYSTEEDVNDKSEEDIHKIFIKKYLKIHWHELKIYIKKLSVYFFNTDIL